jgi:Tol biopolymer transport system component
MIKFKSIAILVVFIIGSSFSALHAQYAAFGKNRVQYEDFDWRFIQSKHFDIYYYGEKNYELAEFAAQSLESAYMQLQADFDHEIVDRIPLIIYDSHNDFSQTNVVALPTSAEGIGGVTDKFKNRMTVPFDGDYNDFRRTLHHELVHAVFNDMFYGGSVQSIISNNIQLVFPLWFEEGLAEYTALGWDTNTDMFIRDAVINGYLPPIPRLSGYYAYRGGQSVWNFIVEEYGREKIAEILNRIKTSRSIEYGFVQSLGLSIQELSERWEESLKKRYFPEVAERQSAKSIATLMTRRGDYGTYNTSPAITPQGDKIAFITNKRGYFDVIVINALNGQKLKTVVRGEDDPDFEELNILNPNLTWSPDGQRIALSTKTKGVDELAIIDYRTRKTEKIRIPNLDAIGSVNWSPDGEKIAFDGNIGPYQDIFVYELQTGTLTNLTGDFFTDAEPYWDNDSQHLFFTSARSDQVELHTYTTDHRLLKDYSIYQMDVYRVKVGDGVAERITNTPGWTEKQPQITRTGRLIYNSDKNGIQNIYEHNLETGEAFPLTDLQTGISQHSISGDGSRIAFSSINEGYLDIFLLKTPFARKKETQLSDNYWAKRRAQEPQSVRVPATFYAQEMYAQGVISGADRAQIEKEAEKDQAETTDSETSGEIDFRNYVFSEEIFEDTTLVLEDQFLFEPDDNVTEDGRYLPRPYRLTFSTDVAYSPSVVASTYGTYAFTQFIISDLLGDHQLSLGTNFQTDLRNSDYSVQYGYLKNRTNFFASYFHTSRQYQTLLGELLRFRTLGLGVGLQYPIDKFRRIDANVTWVSLIRDYDGVTTYFGNAGNVDAQTTRGSFLYPNVSYTKDATLPGFITPQGGTRFTFTVSASPGLGIDSPTFASISGDFRHYVNLGRNSTIALRGSGAVSVGPESQTYFLGGMLGWINYRWSDNGIPFERLTDTFFTLPAMPLRGYDYSSLYGNKYSLINAEFRFPLFAAVIPGAIPILPLYNITGAIFIDAGTAWGYEIDQTFQNINGEEVFLVSNGADLDFRVGEEVVRYYDFNQSRFVDSPNEFTQEFSYLDGDVLIGSGFGLRTIVFGLPFRWDVAWPYGRDGFRKDPIHYFSIGIDF